MVRNTSPRLTDSREQKIRRLGVTALVLTVLIAGLIVSSGAAAAHPSHDYDHVEDPGNELTGGYEDPGVEDHGYFPANGVQEGVLSDGYGGYMGGL